MARRRDRYRRRARAPCDRWASRLASRSRIARARPAVARGRSRLRPARRRRASSRCRSRRASRSGSGGSADRPPALLAADDRVLRRLDRQFLLRAATQTTAASRGAGAPAPTSSAFRSSTNDRVTSSRSTTCCARCRARAACSSGCGRCRSGRPAARCAIAPHARGQLAIDADAARLQREGRKTGRRRRRPPASWPAPPYAVPNPRRQSAAGPGRHARHRQGRDGHACSRRQLEPALDPDSPLLPSLRSSRSL